MCAGADDDRVIAFLNISVLPEELQQEFAICGFWGAHIAPDGRLHIVVEGGDDPIATDLFMSRDGYLFRY